MRYIKGNDFPEIKWHLSPYQIMSLGIAGLIISGTVLLMLPISSIYGSRTGFIDALFTATSSVCVTGLAVVDTGTYYSTFGQMVIITLVQCGAFGFATMTSIMSILMRRRLQLSDRVLLQEELNQLTIAGMVKLVKYIIKTSLLIEFVGGTLLAIRLYFDFGARGVFYGYWHAVSAFCNAGFDVFGVHNGNLTPYVDDITVNLVLTSLIILGGLGFTVYADVMDKRRFKLLTLHTKVALTTTAALIAVGTAGFFIFDFSNNATTGLMTTSGKALASYFQSVTCRTAGFSTVDIGALSYASLFLTMMLMFIGASPGSTGGGIRTTTFAVIAASMWSQLRGSEETVLFYRRIGISVLQKAVTIFFAFFAVTILLTLLLAFSEPEITLTMALFEVVSALSTTGLSMGITPNLNDFSKLVLILAMFIGRVGPVTFLFALALKSKKTNVYHPEGKITIG